MTGPARLRRLHAAAALAGCVAVLATALLPSALAGPAQGSAPTRTEPFAVSGAILRWGVNNETNNRAFAPGTYNFMSAGVVPDPGRGGTTLPRASWRAEDGNVRIEKQQADGGYALATWEGLSTTPQGATISSPTSGQFSNHQVVIGAGTGTVDPATGFATISWTGSFTVLFYSGMSYFTVTDPTLTVTPERAQLTATAGGFASDMDDQSQWLPLPPTPVVLADLPVAEVDLAAADGFVSTPTYLGVDWQAPADEAAQAGGPYRGAFPSSFLDFLATAGTAGYWYSTGGATDAFKPALPLSVSWSGVPVATPSAAASTKPTKRPTRVPTPAPTRQPSPSPTASDPTSPTSSPTTSPTRAPAAATGRPPVTDPASVPSGVDASVPSAAALAAAPALPAVQPVLVAASSTSSTSAAPAAATDSERHALWLLGCVLLLGALATTLISTTLEGRR
ncbi:hypothetical protein [Nocardioides sp. SYSU D00065]|uniref:hypothetical protein n=1 Tax=Nocardioides sp. SYSU D00065 TaxID=2817378 RepID=UPI001B322B61|nr:hypothetical protein [Nocardioides sp. SYSU D00065]